ncbi:MAG TPA: DUF1189 family protein [Thermodesulfovibrionia bacterium]|nr:DUF1189 family protein [Thermodesulfovibrionia bacterium]
MKRYTYFRALIAAFHSKPFYEEVTLTWKGTGIAYLLFLSSFCSIPYTLEINHFYVEFIDKKFPVYIQDFPEIEIKDGQARVSVEQPHYLKHEDKVFAIIDTTGKITSIENSEAFVLITRNHILIKRPQLPTHSLNLKDFGSFRLTKQGLLKSAVSLKPIIPYLIYPFFLLSFFLLHLVQLFFFSIIGLSLAAARRSSQITYRDIFRLSSVAMTPSILIKTFFDYTEINFYLLWLFYFVVAAAYIGLAVHTGILLKEQKSDSV